MVAVLKLQIRKFMVSEKVILLIMDRKKEIHVLQFILQIQI